MGTIVGSTVGFLNGDWEGPIDGFRVDGKQVGNSDGCKVGVKVGMFVVGE